MLRYFLILSAVFIAGCGSASSKGKFTAEQMQNIPIASSENLPLPSGGFVLSIGTQTLDSDEIVRPLAANLNKSAVNSDYSSFSAEVRKVVEQLTVKRIAELMLYQKARLQGGANIEDAVDKAVETEVRKYVMKFGGDWAKAEDQLRKAGSSWEEFRDYQKKLILSQSYIASNLDSQPPITYSELYGAYEQQKEKLFAKDASLTLRLIDIEIEKVEPADANASRIETGRQLASQLIERIRGGDDFGKLASEYSNGYRKDYGGLWEAVNPESLAEPYSVIASTVDNISVGDFGGPLESGGHVFIFKIEDKQEGGIEPFEKVQDQLAAQIAFERKVGMIDDFSKKIVEQAQIANKDAFVAFCVNRLYLLSKRN